LGNNKIEQHSDEELIDLYLATQSSQYFDRLYNRYISKVYSKCISLLKDQTLAEDAAQEIFLKIFLNLARFNRKSKFSTWVYSIAYNFCIDFIRKSKKSKNLFSSDEEEGNDVIEEVEDKELVEMEINRLKIVLDELPVDDKAVILMKYQEELSIKEISEIIGKTESAVKMKIKRAKSKSKKIYQEKFTDED
jgi:RNA polymerase sigma factor (sigma-70 family)